jgi:nitrate reductase NapE component
MIQRTCANHPERKAIGVCVMTGKPICSECSTRYEGVNYSKEGLEMRLAQQRQAEQSSEGSRFWAVIAMMLTPVLLVATYGAFWYLFVIFIDLQQWQSG